MEAPKVSVVITVYNAGERLKECLKSLVNQSLKEIEFIFVLDCPSDGSDRIVYHYSERYDNISIIQNEHNINIGMSRNKGLEIAKGEYVAFCDHDDIVEPSMYEKMYNEAVKSNADIVLGVPEYTYIDNSLNTTYYYPEYNGDYKDKILSLIIGNDYDDKKWNFYFSHGVIWANLYKRSFINENQVRFVDNNKITFEDNLFSIETLNCADKVVVLNELVYHHVIDGHNTAASPNYVKLPLIIGYIHYLYDYLNTYRKYESFRIRFSNSVIMYITGAIVAKVKSNGLRFWLIVPILREIKKDYIIKEAFKNGNMIPRSNKLVQDSALRLINIILKN